MTKRQDEDRALHDYLDDRLSGEERERFEARMEREPELARRVAACREIGRSLREGDEELPPGFYTRARAVFEEASGGRAGRRWFRPLSWETAGLVAVVLVAGALFVPGLVHSPLQREPFAESPRDEKAAFRGVELEEGVAAGQVIDDEIVRQQAAVEREAAPASSDLDTRRATAGEEAVSGLSDPDRAQAPLAANEGLGAVAKKEAPRAGASRDKGKDREAEADWSPSPPAKARTDEAASPPPAPEAKRRVAPPAEESREKADAVRPYLGVTEPADGDLSDRLAATPLPPGLIEAGMLRVIDEPEEWRALLAGSAERVLLDLGGYDPRSRLVLIGARPAPFDCARISIVATGEEYWILLSPPAEGGRAAEHGCALLLPRDGRTIEIGPGGSD